LNRKAGFAEVGVIALKTKQAMLSIATRPAFDATLSLSGTTKMSHYPVPSAQQHLRHLEPQIWKHVNRHLVAKAIAEFSHEQILMPARSDAPHDGGHTAHDDSLHAYVLVSDDGQTQYQYLARPMMLRHWHVSEPSVTRICNG